MLAKKRIVAFAIVLISTLVVGVYAGMQLSPTITATWSLTNTGTELLLYWQPPPPSGTLNKGTWYQYGVRIQRDDVAGESYNVVVKFNITAGANLPLGSVKMQFYAGGGVWVNVAMTGWGTQKLDGEFNPINGPTIPPGYSYTTDLRIWFEGNAPVTSYSHNLWVEQVNV